MGGWGGAWWRTPHGVLFRGRKHKKVKYKEKKNHDSADTANTTHTDVNPPRRGKELSQLRLLFTLSAVVDWLRLLCSNQLIHHACDLAPILPPTHPSLFHCCAATAGEPRFGLALTGRGAGPLARPTDPPPSAQMQWPHPTFVRIIPAPILNVPHGACAAAMADGMRPMIQHKRKRHFYKRLQSHTPESHLPAFFSSPPYRCINKTLMLKYDFIIICPVMELTYTWKAFKSRLYAAGKAPRIQ